MIIHKVSSLAAAVVLAGPLAAQQVAASTSPSCSRMAGAAFGIAGYDCANCGFTSETGKRVQYNFFAAPTVTRIVRTETGIELGDVIEAVDGKPITTQAGADAFAYPGNGKHTLTLRRGRDRREVDVTVANPCDDGIHAGSGSGFGSTSGYGTSSSNVGATSSSSSTSRSRAGRGSGRGVGIMTIGGDSMIVIDGVVRRRGPAVGKFGFAVECNPTCTQMRTPGGLNYYKYDGYPRITEVRAGSPADKAGLRVGDLVVKVDGHSILEDDAGLAATEDRDQLRITVRRDGKDIDALMVVSRSE